jgi:hypothetical protein
VPTEARALVSAVGPYRVSADYVLMVHTSRCISAVGRAACGPDGAYRENYSTQQGVSEVTDSDVVCGEIPHGERQSPIERAPRCIGG